jgi:pimeloyl-ACP methyl ester carboxylesterase
MKRPTSIFLFLLIPLFSLSKISTPTPIDKSDTPVINGIKQYITIKGDDITKPILLFLHGGPGGSVMNEANRFTRELQKHFIVVQWDQRETSRTLQLNPSPVALTIGLMQNDTKELVDHLLKEFDQKKLYLAGYSWGTVLGFYIADKYPELLYAYIAISPVIHQSESEQLTLAMLKQRAAQNNNETELNELSLVKIPFGNSRQLFYSRKWLFAFDGNPMRNADTTGLIRYFENWSRTWLPVWNESLQQNRFSETPTLNCPVYFFVGRKDYQTHFTLAEKYYNQVNAGRKRLYWFENSAHTIINTEAALLQDRIIKEILPETL